MDRYAFFFADAEANDCREPRDGYVRPAIASRRLH